MEQIWEGDGCRCATWHRDRSLIVVVWIHLVISLVTRACQLVSRRCLIIGVHGAPSVLGSVNPSLHSSLGVSSESAEAHKHTDTAFICNHFL